jgi:hypothetical protein
MGEGKVSHSSSVARSSGHSLRAEREGCWLNPERSEGWIG